MNYVSNLRHIVALNMTKIVSTTLSVSHNSLFILKNKSWH